jgi:hypothetical protein
MVRIASRYRSLAISLGGEAVRLARRAKLAVTLFVPAITKSARSVAISEVSPTDPTT